MSVFPIGALVVPYAGTLSFYSNTDGSFLGSMLWANIGSGGGTPNGVAAIASGRFAVLEYAPARLAIYAPSGAFVASAAPAGTTASLILKASNAHFFVGYTNFSSGHYESFIAKYSQDGVLLSTFQLPAEGWTGGDVDEELDVLINDFMVSPDGSTVYYSGRSRGFATPPTPRVYHSAPFGGAVADHATEDGTTNSVAYIGSLPDGTLLLNYLPSNTIKVLSAPGSVTASFAGDGTAAAHFQSEIGLVSDHFWRRHYDSFNPHYWTTTGTVLASVVTASNLWYINRVEIDTTPGTPAVVPRTDKVCCDTETSPTGASAGDAPEPLLGWTPLLAGGTIVAASTPIILTEVWDA